MLYYNVYIYIYIYMLLSIVKELTMIAGTCMWTTC